MWLGLCVLGGSRITFGTKEFSLRMWEGRAGGSIVVRKRNGCNSYLSLGLCHRPLFSILFLSLLLSSSFSGIFFALLLQLI
jgi:hypothetical protein